MGKYKQLVLKYEFHCNGIIYFVNRAMSAGCLLHFGLLAFIVSVIPKGTCRWVYWYYEHRLQMTGAQTVYTVLNLHHSVHISPFTRMKNVYMYRRGPKYSPSLLSVILEMHLIKQRC